jgi:hypothetical protein
MHYIRCHPSAIKNGYGERVNRKLQAKFRLLTQRYADYRKAHP